MTLLHNIPFYPLFWSCASTPIAFALLHLAAHRYAILVVSLEISYVHTEWFNIQALLVYSSPSFKCPEFFYWMFCPLIAIFGVWTYSISAFWLSSASGSCSKLALFSLGQGLLVLNPFTGSLASHQAAICAVGYLPNFPYLRTHNSHSLFTMDTLIPKLHNIIFGSL